MHDSRRHRCLCHITARHVDHSVAVALRPFFIASICASFRIRSAFVPSLSPQRDKNPVLGRPRCRSAFERTSSNQSKFATSAIDGCGTAGKSSATARRGLRIGTASFGPRVPNPTPGRGSHGFANDVPSPYPYVPGASASFGSEGSARLPGDLINGMPGRRAFRPAGPAPRRGDDRALSALSGSKSSRASRLY